ncbi:allantoinase AllB [soil metagenome]
MSVDIVFRSRRVVTPDGEAALNVLVRDGRIAELHDHAEPPQDVRCIDVGELPLLPGLVDTHVHLNDPGRDDWEGFETGTRAAAAGGVTTLVDMPLNSIPPTTTLAGLDAKRAAARGRCHVNVGFWGGIVPGNLAEIGRLHDAGVLGFKCFLAPSGVAEFGHVTAADLVRVLPLLAETGAPLLVHAELLDAGTGATANIAVQDDTVHSGRREQAAERSAYSTYLATRPDSVEVEAVRLLVELCRETRVRIHIVHVASALVLPLLEAARNERLPITAETCPHYLHFAAEDIGDGRTEYKCAPPIRSASNRDALWRGLADGDLDLIASDHSPAPPALKRAGDGSFMEAWGGIASLQLTLPVVWTGARRRGFTLSDVSNWLAAAPARLAGLQHKGAIAVGFDADFVVFDDEAEFTVTADTLLCRHPHTPYAGATLTGVVLATHLAGAVVYDADGGGSGPPAGLLILRTRDGAEWTSQT